MRSPIEGEEAITAALMHAPVMQQGRRYVRSWCRGGGVEVAQPL